MAITSQKGLQYLSDSVFGCRGTNVPWLSIFCLFVQGSTPSGGQVQAAVQRSRAAEGLNAIGLGGGIPLAATAHTFRRSLRKHSGAHSDTGGTPITSSARSHVSHASHASSGTFPDMHVMTAGRPMSPPRSMSPSGGGFPHPVLGGASFLITAPESVNSHVK